MSELYAYHKVEDGFRIIICDSTRRYESDRSMINMVFGNNAHNQRHSSNLVVVRFPIDEGGDPIGPSDVVVFRLGVYQVAIDNVIDLRLRSVQDWFVDLFGRLECEGGLAGVYGMKVSKSEIIGFRYMIPALLSRELGGSNFCDSVGSWMISHKINALIYPSARSNVVCSSTDNEVNYFRGWNIVIYAGHACNADDDKAKFGASGGWAREEDADIARIKWADDGVTRSFDVVKL